MIVFKGKLLGAGKGIQTELKEFSKPEMFVCTQWQAKKGDFVFWHGLTPNSSETKAIYLFWCEIVLRN